MGRGSKRKSSDSPKLEPRKQSAANGTQSNGGGGGAAGHPKNEYCPVSFGVRLSAQPRLPESAKVLLVLEGEQLVIKYAGTVMGTLPDQLNKKIKKCLANYRYTGAAKKKEGIQYAEFQRSA